MESGDTSPRAFEPADLVGELFAERFRVLRLVSTGANTAIFDATDEPVGRKVTLKLVRPKLAASPSFRSRFDATMRAVASLSHPNIAAVYDWGVARVGDTSTAYVVNEFLAGGSLRDLFDRGRRLSPSQALAVGLDACRALDHAHRRGFVHLELTPSKIVFGDDRRLRIIDFGLASLLGAPAWEQPDSVPTHVAWYAAPEQGLGQPVDGRADVYALCLLLHEAVTGTLPFKSDSTVACLSARVGRLMPVSADLGPLASVLERAGRPDADERSTSAEFGKALLAVATKLPRPEPLPLLSSGLFETPVEQMRTPDDPTGGVTRPADTPDLVVVPLDEPDADTADDEPAEEVEPLVVAPLDAGPDAGQINAVTHVVADAATDGATDLPAEVVDDLVIAGDDTTVIGVTAPAVEQRAVRRRRFPWRVVLGALLLVALGALVFLAMQLFQRPTYAVPDLVGLPEAEARNLVAPNGWVIDVQHERSDDVPTPGAVVRTAPASGVELAEGEPFQMVISDGPLLRELPDSTGLPLSEAQTQLNSLRLVVDVTEAYDEVVPAGSVISWSVPGDATLTTGSMVLPDTMVELVVSKGPEPRTVPNMIGRSPVEVRAELEAMGLVLVEGEQVFSDDITLGAIVSQSVPEGTQVERGTEITVVISRGPDLVVFPDLSAAPNYQAAADLLVQAGFEPVLVLGDAEGVVDSYTIDGETPEVGETFRRGTRVELRAL